MIIVFLRKITPKKPTKNSILETIINSLIPIVIIKVKFYFSASVVCFLLMTMTPIMATKRRKPIT